ncbi:unnamed protein product [Aspergillus oryzae RIB40]|uniref:DNA, SC026 n=1 Tax=Aspergillus oryzae (strain ATCC 42149 / RIB 40) TaxID=510516 RepID=Q2UF65_ASPOR|nr:unnamed protein product [Aspergillus oryzae RIB40]BAE59800.1 unnamed protein product [Aspergillus oryzae RIB40]
MHACTPFSFIAAAVGSIGYQRNSCGYCKSDNGSPSNMYPLQARRTILALYQYVPPIMRNSSTVGGDEIMLSALYDEPSSRERTNAKRSIAGTNSSWDRNTSEGQLICAQKHGSESIDYDPNMRTGLTSNIFREKRHRKCNFDLLTAVHEAEYSNVKRPIDPKTKRYLEPAHRFEVNIEGDSVSQAKYELFLKYQTKVHKEDVSTWQQKDFKRFLCSGLKRSPADPKSTEKKLGSWHQCYRLDGKLIAVAVLDLMPSGVSSVYIFYDPDYEQWEFGKLSALREIALSIEGSYQYYYMGYYIHSCQKMRYKGSFKPQYILDPESYTWDPLDGELAKKLDERPYVSLSRDRRLAAEGTPESAGTEADAEINDDEVSLFDLRMPGVLSLEEVEPLDLDHWLLLVHGSFVHMIDLVGWETMPMDNPQSVKGIIAELAAVLGPKIVKESAVVLFD